MEKGTHGGSWSKYTKGYFKKNLMHFKNKMFEYGYTHLFTIEGKEET